LSELAEVPASQVAAKEREGAEHREGLEGQQHHTPGAFLQLAKQHEIARKARLVADVAGRFDIAKVHGQLQGVCRHPRTRR